MNGFKRLICRRLAAIVRYLAQKNLNWGTYWADLADRLDSLGQPRQPK